MEMLKLLDANELIAQIICFLIFLAIMRVFLWKRFLGIIDKRRDAVSSELKKIEDARGDLARTREDYEKRLAGIDDEAKAKIQEAMEEGRRLSEELRARAETESEKILEKAKDNIKDEVAKAREELKDDIVDIAIQAAEKVLQEKLTEESDRRLAEDFIEGISKK